MTTPPRTNFGFVGLTFPRLLAECRNAEAAAVSNPRGALFQVRYVAEQIVRHICAFHDLGTEGSFVALAGTREFRSIVPQSVQDKIHAVRRIGNVAAHGSEHLDSAMAVRAVGHLYDLMVWAAANVSDKGHAAVPTTGFDEQILWDAPKQKEATNAELKKLARELEDRKTEALQLSAEREALRQEREQHLREQERFKAKAAADAEEYAALKAELEQLRKELAAQTRKELVAAQEVAGEVDTSELYVISEADTRRDVIDPMLAEAGFSTAKGNMRVEVVLPSGRADYVLYGKDGKALAVVEAKKPSITMSAGREQARCYADDLEKQYGQRPLIYYTTGHEVHLWDDAAALPGCPATGYQPREVEGYANADELYAMIHKRARRMALTSVDVDADIAGRTYQQQMIRAVTERFTEGHRRALLVMATGTGKTRVSIALVKLLQQAGWVKNVLFLADRKGLVNQAATNFEKHYPTAGVVNLLSNPEGSGTVYLSTYQSMIKKIGTEYSPFAFDLVILDEAHRSIYHRYARIFEYFDSYLLGLTATPRAEVDHNTYRLFHLQDGEPTGNYGLAEAVKAGYLVPYRVFEAESVILRQGIAYKDLSDEEKIKWDNEEWGTDEDGNPLPAPEEANASEINATLYNETTINKVVSQVLEHGIKVAGADKLGKTIFFARTKKHAELIYDALVAANTTLRVEVITHDNPKSDSLIEQLESTAEGSIDVAISVDMLDTGIDVPACVNLVFFKPVHSNTKFWQMIGRGTRLCENLFGEGLHKKEFFVFDYCDNIRQFDSEITTSTTRGSGQKSLSERIFIKRLRLLGVLPDGELRASISAHLREQLATVPDDSPLVRPAEKPLLHAYRRPEPWNNLDAADLTELEEHLAHLPFASAGENEHAKRFDMLILGMQEALAGGSVGSSAVTRVQRVARNLLTKLNVPAIASVAELMENIVDDDWWDGVTIDDLELVRRKLRSLVHYADRGERKVVVVDVTDELGDLVEVPLGFEGASAEVTESSVEQKIRDVLDKHGDALVLQKIRRAKPLTSVDVASLETLLQVAGPVTALEATLGMSLTRFVRTLVGLEEAAAREAFADILTGSRLNSVQLAFMSQVIDGLVQNGIVTMKDLFDTPYDDYGTPFEVFEDNTAMVIDLKERLERIEQSAEEIS
ncbi:DEAD/DEAH box helicase family protein [Corynebacterium hindlerae]|uniref:DEAD/DEAH box helicase family protein n=1 Tax=Corynebacterium hindlerae TaxID=699041 RepID=UPI001AD76E5E|nr:DEAD/DEAH box helicase family protein [Corynebacterium hindlerae]QTH59878.1 DEAD/DEAH box helicase family protein [Corynebacterium hindlerae]